MRIHNKKDYKITIEDKEFNVSSKLSKEQVREMLEIINNATAKEADDDAK